VWQYNGSCVADFPQGTAAAQQLKKKRKQSNYTKQIKTQIYLFARPK
jgi:hypothetical protein